MRTNSGADIIVDGDVVLKVHRLGTDRDLLALRLRVAERLGRDENGPLLAPLGAEPEPRDGPEGRRWCSRWPLVDVVDMRDDGLPWAEAAGLLARLHLASQRVAFEHGADSRVRRALKRLPATAPPVIGQAAAALPARALRAGSPDRPRTLVHGDFHLGQLGRRAGGAWTLIDIDDLGVGDPAWDLARPAGFWAAGLIPDGHWHAFLDAYRRAFGPAVPAVGDPWEVLEPLARAAVVAAAASGCHRDPDETQAELVAACGRMATI